MPLGEIIGEIVIRPILEIVLYGIGYWTGAVFLKTVTFGRIRLAPFSTMDEKNRSKKKQKWYQSDWDIWLRRPMQGRSLKAECTLIVGILVWVIVGCGIYFATRESEPSARSRSACAHSTALDCRIRHQTLRRGWSHCGGRWVAQHRDRPHFRLARPGRSCQWKSDQESRISTGTSPS